MELKPTRVNEARFRDSFDALSRIGATPSGGVNRPAFSEEHLAACRWFLAEAKQYGLETKVDGAGNHFAVLQGSASRGKVLLLGSHLDSVPNGGRFDGALGVVAALEVLKILKETGTSPPFAVEAVAFADEEGRYIDLFGSQAFTGSLKKEHLRNMLHMEEFIQAIRRFQLSEASILSARRDTASLEGYLELHIEQGPRLVDQGISIGIVSGIVGIRTFRIKFKGRSDHAGTTPMDKRQDAALGASSFVLAARSIINEQFPNRVATVGNMLFSPGASNVVPEEVTVSFEFRSDDAGELDRMQEKLLACASVEAKRFELQLEVENVGWTVPAAMNGMFQKAIGDISQMLGLKSVSIPSGAGHDAQSLATVCPAGMIFVPSSGGFSHSSREFTKWQDCVNGANVLLNTVLNIAGEKK